jgi:hypothetical protein
LPPRCINPPPEKPKPKQNETDDAVNVDDVEMQDPDYVGDEDDPGPNDTTCEVATYMEILYQMMNEMLPFFNPEGDSQWSYDEQRAHKYFFQKSGKLKLNMHLDTDLHLRI